MAPLRQVAVLRIYIGTVTMSGVGTGAPLGGLITSVVGWRWYARFRQMFYSKLTFQVISGPDPNTFSVLCNGRIEASKAH